MSNRRIKVLHLIGGLNRGGAEMVVVNLCNNIDKECFDTKVCTLMDQVPLAQRLREPDSFLGSCGRAPGIPSLRNQYYSLKRLRRLIADFKPDVIHSHLYSLAAPMHWFGAFRFRCKHVVTIHSAGLHYSRTDHWPSVVFRWCERMNLRLCRPQVIAVSEAVRQMCVGVLGVPLSRAHTIPNGVDTETFSPERFADTGRADHGYQPDTILIVHVGRMDGAKGHDTLLHAWPEVMTHVPNARLVLIGDGAQSSRLKEKAESLGIAESVDFLGKRDDVPEVLSICDVAVFPSLYEGQPLAVLEMMAMGLPVVCSEIPPLMEVVNPPEAGMAVPVKDSSKLADAVLRMIKEMQLRKDTGIRARERVERQFSVRQQVLKHQDLYLRLMDK